MNHRYQQFPPETPEHLKLPTYRIHTLDTGNVLLNVEALRTNGLRFQMFPDSTNCGGEDTLMAMQIYVKGGEVRGSPWAVSLHLEKPEVRFNEFSARGELIQRSMDQLGMSPELKEAMRPEMMPWCWQKENTGEIRKFTP